VLCLAVILTVLFVYYYIELYKLSVASERLNYNIFYFTLEDIFGYMYTVIFIFWQSAKWCAYQTNTPKLIIFSIGLPSKHDERYGCHVIGRCISRQYSIASQRFVHFRRRRHGCAVAYLDDVTHVVGAIKMASGDIAPHASRRPRRKCTLRFRPTKYVWNTT